MMDHHQNAMLRLAQAAAEDRVHTRIGVISSYDPSSYMAKVELQPDGIVTGWMPIGALGIGSGFGVQVAPNLGDQCEVRFIDGDINSGVIGFLLFSDSARPVALASGEILVRHSSGARLWFRNDGSVDLEAASINSVGPWGHHGNFTVSGGDVRADGISLKTHVHGGVSPGGSNTGAPT